ncbi:MAG: hypothetical protein NUV75_02115 [Gallionella sp.]|nr:hypothetical protein [Gallionella sp.]
MSKKDAVIYRRAAREMERDDDGELFSCILIRTLCNFHGKGLGPTAQQYSDLFKPRLSVDSGKGWGEEWGNDARDCRILALCFAAAMAEANDL